MIWRLNKNPFGFALIFLSLFALLYYFNLFFIGLTTAGNRYIPFFDANLNYVKELRFFLIKASSLLLNLLGYVTLTNEFELMVVGKGIIRIVYTCLGFGLMSFFTAFVIAFPKKIKSKIVFVIGGLITIQLLNVIRFVLLALLWNRQTINIIDHHTLFNLIIYVLIAISLYFWVKHNDNKMLANAKN